MPLSEDFSSVLLNIHNIEHGYSFLLNLLRILFAENEKLGHNSWEKLNGLDWTLKGWWKV